MQSVAPSCDDGEDPSALRALEPTQVDGPMDLSLKTLRGGDTTAIFVHAGAGYHSFQHQNVHLEACEE